MNLQTSLYDHQAAAVAKLLPTRVGALFMEMGTGKTRTAIELVARRQARIDRVIWLCPVTLKATIAYEIAKHTDAQPADICVFDDRTNQRNVSHTAFWVIAGIESMSSSNRVVLAVNSLITDHTCVIVDESDYIKGHAARRTLRITAAAERARYRLLLTGTPLSQGIVDLFAQMRFLSPAILGYRSFYSFAANHLEYSDKYPGLIARAHNVDHLAAKIAPYTYQVTKEECLTLPRKLYDVRYYSLTDEQRAAYVEAKWELFLSLPDDQISSYAIFRMFTALQQIVSGFQHRDGKVHEYAHSRLALLQSYVDSIHPDAKIIIWCKYHYSIAQIVAHLIAAYGADSVAQYHGALNEKQRAAQLDRWRPPAGARFLVAMLSSGGRGLTLNEANYAIFYENNFKYSERMQAEDRCHRIGQTSPVTYGDIVASATIDQRIQDAIAAKGDVVESFRREVKDVRDRRGDSAKLAEAL